ncbi:glycosyltransferase family 4 protein, partial [Lactiplantibacillus garii]|uniref:glycosyltransferase family 4 protein n=1 Tax=Lactiplantibacillus garii TaxID=2306423 RepID=UPI0021F0664B
MITHPKVAFMITSYLAGHFADKIVAVSGQVKKHLVESNMVDSDLVQVIYNGIDTAKFYPHKVDEHLREEFNLQSSNVVVGMVGRLNAWKGQSTLLKSMIPLLKTNTNLRLVFVGGVFAGEEHFRSELESLIHESGVASQIVLKNFRTDMQDVYQLFDVFSLPSTSPDPLPTVVLEAMASGKPVVGFEHGGVTEMVHDGYNGYLVPAISVSEMTSAI